MDDYISVNYAYNRLIKRAAIDSQPRAIRRAAKILLELPLADVRENVRGEWQNVVVRNKGDDVLQAIESVASMQCPKCERWHNEVYLYGNPTEMSNFCPNCGADLRKEDKHGL